MIITLPVAKKGTGGNREHYREQSSMQPTVETFSCCLFLLFSQSVPEILMPLAVQFSAIPIIL